MPLSPRPRWLGLVAIAYTLCVVAIVLVASLLGTSHAFAFVTRIPYGDKLGHFGLIGSLAMLADLALGRRDLRVGRVHLPLAPCAVMLLVTLEELSQRWLPSKRTFDLYDLGADLLGVLAFVLTARLVARSTPASPRASEPTAGSARRRTIGDDV